MVSLSLFSCSFILIGRLSRSVSLIGLIKDLKNNLRTLAHSTFQVASPICGHCYINDTIFVLEVIVLFARLNICNLDPALIHPFKESHRLPCTTSAVLFNRRSVRITEAATPTITGTFHVDANQNVDIVKPLTRDKSAFSVCNPTSCLRQKLLIEFVPRVTKGRARRASALFVPFGGGECGCSSWLHTVF